MSQETFGRTKPDELLEPVNDRVESSPPPEVYQVAAQSEYKDVLKQLADLRRQFESNKQLRITTSLDMLEQYRKLAARALQLEQQLPPSPQGDLFTGDKKTKPTITTRAA